MGVEGKTVLVVDDEPSVVTYLTTLLEDDGYGTLSAEDGIEGMRLAVEKKPDLVLLDINMPKKSGVRMYRELKEDETLASTPVIIVTAVTGYGGNPEEFHRFIASRKHVPPPEGFVAKPIEREAFLNLVRQIIGR